MKTYSILLMLYCINGEWSGVSIIFRSYPTSIWMRHWQCLHQNKQFIRFSHLLRYTLLSAGRKNFSWWRNNWENELEVTIPLQKLIKICCISIEFDPLLVERLLLSGYVWMAILLFQKYSFPSKDNQFVLLSTPSTIQSAS